MVGEIHSTEMRLRHHSPTDPLAQSHAPMSEFMEPQSTPYF